MNPIQLLKNRMRCKCWEIEDLAYVLQIPKSQATRIINQKSAIPAKIAKQLHHIFKINISSLMMSYYQQKIQESLQDAYDPVQDHTLQNRILLRQKANATHRRQGRWGGL